MANQELKYFTQPTYLVRDEVQRLLSAQFRSGLTRLAINLENIRRWSMGTDKQRIDYY